MIRFRRKLLVIEDTLKINAAAEELDGDEGNEL